MVKESGKAVGSGKDHRQTSSSSRGRESSRDLNRSERDRSSSSEPSTSKRLRNEGDSRKVEDVGSSRTSSAGASLSDKTKFKTPPPPAQSATVTTAQSLTTSSATSGKGGGVAMDETNVGINKKDVYEKATEYENAEAKRLNTADALKAIDVLYSRFENNVQEIKALKLAGIKNTEDEEDLLDEKMGEGLMLISSFRRISRLLKLKLKFAKEELFSVRNDVDSDHLLLQNLLYEATHVQDSVAAVQDYKGKDSEIELIPVEEFLKQAPGSIAKHNVKDDPHLLRIARLEYEYVQRDKLQEDLDTLEREKELTSKSIQEKQEKFDSLLPLLKKVLDATRPVQDFFQIDISAKKEQAAIAQYLPPELYVLLVQSNGYQEARGQRSNFLVRICGNVESAKEFVVSPDDVEEDSDSDKEPDQDIEISERRLLRKKSSIHITPEESRKKLIQKYPLWVEWVVKSKDGDCAVIQFFYLIKLRIITVKAKRCSNQTDCTKPSECEIANPEDLLTELLPNDSGKDSPNPANSFLFSKVDSCGIEEFVNDTGRPYRWAQKLAGLEFPYPVQGSQITDYENFFVQPNHRVSATNIEQVLKLIRCRLNNQTILWNQLKALESRNIQIPPGAKDMFPVKMSSSFKSWEPVSWSYYISCNFTEEPIRLGCVTEKHIYYKATLERGRATLVALVAFSQNFPSVPPLFCVQLEQDGERRDARNDVAIRELEKEVNVYSPKELSEWNDSMASLQIQRLIQCTDIILETDFMLGESAGPSEFGREKLFLRAASGRNLRRPFKFFGVGGGYFSQRY